MSATEQKTEILMKFNEIGWFLQECVECDSETFTGNEFQSAREYANIFNFAIGTRLYETDHTTKKEMWLKCQADRSVWTAVKSQSS